MRTIIAIVTLMFLCGCANVRVATPAWSMRASSFCKDIQIPKVHVSTSDGSRIDVEGYSSTVNAIALQAATDQIISTIIRQGIKAYLP